MAITSRQFEQLTEMGISLWQSRTHRCVDDSKQISYQVQSQQNLTTLTKNKLFNDILHSLNLTVGDVTVQGDHLDIGLFNWYFVNENIDKNSKENQTEAISQEKNSINCINNKLISPNIETIAQSSLLKKQLWHTIAKNLL